MPDVWFIISALTSAKCFTFKVSTFILFESNVPVILASVIWASAILAVVIWAFPILAVVIFASAILAVVIAASAILELWIVALAIRAFVIAPS